MHDCVLIRTKMLKRPIRSSTAKSRTKLINTKSPSIIHNLKKIQVYNKNPGILSLCEELLRHNFAAIFFVIVEPGKIHECVGSAQYKNMNIWRSNMFETR